MDGGTHAAPAARCATVAGSHRRVIVAHETGGEKYYGVIKDLAARDGFALDFVETMIERELVRRALHGRRMPAGALAFWAKNWRFRLSVPWVRADAIVLGMGPWDPRIAWYGRLARSNRLLYSASWPDWESGAVPRRYGPFDGLLGRLWQRALTQPNAEVVAVTPMVAASLERRFPGVRTSVVPHVAGRAFFARRRPAPRPTGRPLKVIQVGEVSAKKGIGLWPEILARFGQRPIEVSIVGEGPLDGTVAVFAEAHPIRAYGQIRDQDRLAALVAEHDVLLVPSQRTDRWQELFGMVIVEAQAAGVVPVASDHVGPRQIVTDGKDGFLVAEGDAAGFAERLRRLDDDAVLLERLRTGAAARAERYHPDVIARLWQARLFPAG